MTCRPLAARTNPSAADTFSRLPSSRREAPTSMRLFAAVLAAAACGAPSLATAQAPVDADRPAGAQAAEGYLSEDAMQIMYGREMDFGDLGRNEVRAGFFLNEERDLIGMADMMIDVGQARRRPNWSLDVGPRVYGALLTVEDQDVFSIALGGTLSYFLGRTRSTAISLSAFYAPDIVTFGEADNIKDLSVQIETRLTDATQLFIGVRTFEFDLAADREVDDNMHVGVRYRF